MQRFDLYRASSPAEAAAIFRERGEGGLFLAGGTDLLVQIKEAHRPVRYVVSLNTMEDLDGIAEEHGALVIGARSRMAQVAAHPTVVQRFSALADGAGVVGSIQTRHMATIGGNVCNAAPSADTSPPLAVLDASLEVMGAAGERAISIGDFWTGPGRTVLQPGELVTRIRLSRPGERSGSHYQRHTPRKVMDIAAVGTAVYLELDAEGTCTLARVALGAVAPTVIRAPQTEALLVGKRIDEAVASEAGSMAASEARPISDQRGSAEFRRHLVGVMTKQSVLRALERAHG
jgi:CO/xanthine dehydrogenase FAD-binding subunit